MVATKKQIKIPVTVGSRNARIVHFQLLVSFLIVRQVVEQGQWNREKRIIHTAVSQVHPLSINKAFNSVKLFISIKLPCAKYDIIAIGSTISLAGKPRMKAIRITPSRPMSLANGSRKLVQCASTEQSPTVMFAISQMMMPAGAATEIALPKTNNVLSNIERMITFPI